MLSQTKKNLYLLIIFKIATIVHIVCLIANLTMHHYISLNSIINSIVAYSLFMSVVTISAIIGIKTIQFFTQQHHNLMHHYKILGFIIESCIAGVVSTLLFFNQAITGKFIAFIANLSYQAHSNKIMAVIILLILLFSLELYRAQKINKTFSEKQSIATIILFHSIMLIIKLTIIMATAIGFTYPMIQILPNQQLQQFDTLILYFTTTEFFLYIHTIIMILVSLWILMGIYYGYKFYKNHKRR